MKIQLKNERRLVAATALDLLKSGLVINTSGNVSIRRGDYVAITPSGRSYESLQPADVVVLNLAGDIVDSDLLPSSETPLHLSIYQSDLGVNSIVHTHSVFATAVSTLVDVLPAIHYQIADLGGPVPVVMYQTFGTPELAASVTRALQGRTAALMQNHGSITIGDTVDQALSRTITLEWLCRVYLTAIPCGEPSILDAEELKRVSKQQEKFRTEQQRRLDGRF